MFIAHGKRGCIPITPKMIGLINSPILINTGCNGLFFFPFFYQSSRFTD